MKSEQTETLVSRQYKRVGLFAESWKRLRTNPGAMFGLGVLIVMTLLMIYSFLFISREQIMAIDPLNRLSPPSWQHPFGTDNMGRDLFVRTIYGTRFSLAVGFGSVAYAMVIGTFLGAIAGFYGKWVDELILRVADVISSIPALLLGMVIVALLGASLTNLLIAVGISVIPSFIRMTRAAVLSAKGNEYVESAKAIGMSTFRTIFTQVLPNCISPLIVTATARIASSVLQAAALSFLGFGVRAPLPEWGALVSAGRNYIRLAPHITLYPGLFIMLVTFACALLGDGLRDALDPQLKK